MLDPIELGVQVIVPGYNAHVVKRKATELREKFRFTKADRAMLARVEKMSVQNEWTAGIMLAGGVISLLAFAATGEEGYKTAAETASSFYVGIKLAGVGVENTVLFEYQRAAEENSAPSVEKS